MYIPYVRGKQFELLALKEYASDLGAAGTVSPAIEPVKNPFQSGGLTRCLVALIGQGVRPMVIINPQVGDLREDPDASEGIVKYLGELDPGATSIDASMLIHQDTTVNEISALVQLLPAARSLVLCHVAKNANLEEMGRVLGQRAQHHVIPADARPRLYKTAFPGADLSILADGFPAQTRNADYLPVTASEFSDDFLYYEEEGFAGFGDYLTIGSGWSEGGFTPRAVAIHWTYQNPAGGPIMIRHFVSTSNGDISNVGRKYLEAVEKLVDFLPQARFVTRAGEAFAASLDSASYPGLGIVKKLSMQNHLEVVLKAIGPQ